MTPLEGLSPFWTGVLAILVVLVGAPLAAWIKGFVDRRMKRDDLEHASQESDEKQIREDLKSERENSAKLRADMTVLREEADRERTARVNEAEKYNLKAQEFLDDIAKSRAALRQSYNDAEEQRRAHEVAMQAQRDEHAAQMNAMRARHNRDLDRRDKRIVVLEKWIVDGHPPPPPKWDDVHD